MIKPKAIWSRYKLKSKNPESPVVNNNINKIIILLACSLIMITLIFTAGCNYSLLDAVDSEEKDKQYINGKDDSFMEEEKSILNQSIPLLDQNIPKNLETATLAMG